MKRFTIHADHENLILAARAARYGVEDMPGKAAILEYENGVVFYIRRTKVGLVVRQDLTKHQPIAR